MARLINAEWSQEDLDKWEDEIIELVYSNMLRRIQLVTVEERKEYEQSQVQTRKANLHNQRV